MPDIWHRYTNKGVMYFSVLKHVMLKGYETSQSKRNFALLHFQDI